jgi:hypothetical protein
MNRQTRSGLGHIPPPSQPDTSSPSSSSSNIGVPLSLLGLSSVILCRLPPLGVEAEVDADCRLIRLDMVVTCLSWFDEL